MLPIPIRLCLIAALVLEVIENVFPQTNWFLPIGGNEIFQFAFFVVLSIAYLEICDCFRNKKD